MEKTIRTALGVSNTLGLYHSRQYTTVQVGTTSVTVNLFHAHIYTCGCIPYWLSGLL